MMDTAQSMPPGFDIPQDAIPVNEMRERILAATARLIVTNGLEFPMSRVAQESRAAVGSIYNHFPSKHDLVVGVYQRIANQIERALTSVPSDMDTPKARIMVYIHAYIDFFWEDPDRAILFEYLSNAPLISTPDVARMFQTLRSFNFDLFSQAQAQGILKPMPPRSMAGFVGGGIRNALRWHRIGRQPLSDAQRRDIAQMCWSAIAIDAGPL